MNKQSKEERNKRVLDLPVQPFTFSLSTVQFTCTSLSWTILFCPHCRWWCYKKMICQTTKMCCTTSTADTFVDKFGLAKGHSDWKTWDGFIGCGSGTAIPHCREEKRLCKARKRAKRMSIELCLGLLTLLCRDKRAVSSWKLHSHSQVSSVSIRY